MKNPKNGGYEMRLKDGGIVCAGQLQVKHGNKWMPFFKFLQLVERRVRVRYQAK